MMGCLENPSKHWVVLKAYEILPNYEEKLRNDFQHAQQWRQENNLAPLDVDIEKVIAKFEV